MRDDARPIPDAAHAVIERWTDPARPGRLDVRAPDHLDRGRERALEAEAAVDEVDVVVDGLGDRHPRGLEGAPVDLGGQLHGAADGAVAAHHEEDVDPQRLQVVDHLSRVLRAA